MSTTNLLVEWVMKSVLFDFLVAAYGVEVKAGRRNEEGRDKVKMMTSSSPLLKNSISIGRVCKAVALPPLSHRNIAKRDVVCI